MKHDAVFLVLVCTVTGLLLLGAAWGTRLLRYGPDAAAFSGAEETESVEAPTDEVVRFPMAP